MGEPEFFLRSLILIMRQYSTAIGAIPPSGIFLKQCIISSIFDQTNVIGGWFHVVINLQPMIPDKGGVI